MLLAKPERVLHLLDALPDALLKSLVSQKADDSGRSVARVRSTFMQAAGVHTRNGWPGFRMITHGQAPV